MEYTKRRVELSEGERKQLQGMLKKGVHSARMLQRAQILLKVDSSVGAARSYKALLDELGVHPPQVSRLIGRYLEGDQKRR